MGPRGLGEGVVEVKVRLSGKKMNLTLEEAVNFIVNEYTSEA
ncbi:hypothetical protein OAP69_00025 [Hellea sp.]|nr:hypothetical protein [Hellea sp.]